MNGIPMDPLAFGSVSSFLARSRSMYHRRAMAACNTGMSNKFQTHFPSTWCCGHGFDEGGGRGLLDAFFVPHVILWRRADMNKWIYDGAGCESYVTVP